MACILRVLVQPFADVCMTWAHMYCTYVCYIHVCACVCVCVCKMAQRAYSTCVQFVRTYNTLTSLLCPHSHFFTKVSYSILVCCSHRHIVGRVVHQTRNVIGQFRPSRNSDYFIESVVDIIRSVHSSVLHLIHGRAVVMSWKGDNRCSKVSMQCNLIMGITYTMHKL